MTRLYSVVCAATRQVASCVRASNYIFKQLCNNKLKELVPVPSDSRNLCLSPPTGTSSSSL